MRSRLREAIRRLRKISAYLIAAYGVAAVTALIVLRVQVDALSFIGVGWIIVLALLPLLPWLVPRLGEFMKTVSPYVQSFSLGVVTLEFREVRSDAIAIPTTGPEFAAVPNDLAALSSGETISLIVSALRDLRRQGGSPVGIVDLREGRKWRLPNLYFLARLLEIEPVVSELVFTDIRGGSDGYLVGVCRPAELRRQIEQAVATYTAAASTLRLPTSVNFANTEEAQEIGNAFQTFQSSLGFSSGREDDPINGFVTTARIAELVGILSGAAIEAPGDMLSQHSLRTIIEASHQFVPTTKAGRLTGIIDRDAVGLAVARAVLGRT